MASPAPPDGASVNSPPSSLYSSPPPVVRRKPLPQHADLGITIAHPSPPSSIPDNNPTSPPSTTSLPRSPSPVEGAASTSPNPNRYVNHHSLTGANPDYWRWSSICCPGCSSPGRLTVGSYRAFLDSHAAHTHRSPYESTLLPRRPSYSPW
jgi:hypothetical protein